MWCGEPPVGLPGHMPCRRSEPVKYNLRDEWLQEEGLPEADQCFEPMCKVWCMSEMIDNAWS